MKKLSLAACLAIVATVVAPVASASAATLVGTCTITGTAEFTPEGLPALLTEAKKLNYAFGSGGIGPLWI